MGPDYTLFMGLEYFPWREGIFPVSIILGQEISWVLGTNDFLLLSVWEADGPRLPGEMPKAFCWWSRADRPTTQRLPDQQGGSWSQRIKTFPAVLSWVSFIFKFSVNLWTASFSLSCMWIGNWNDQGCYQVRQRELKWTDNTKIICPLRRLLAASGETRNRGKWETFKALPWEASGK